MTPPYDIQQVWEEVLKKVLLGADRSRLSEATKAFLCHQQIDTDKELSAVLLEAAAWLGPVRKVGWAPSVWQGGLLEKSNDGEAATPVNARSAHHLQLILAGSFADALEEYIYLMRATNRQLPYDALPELLTMCVKDEELWRRLQPVLGERGRWLARLHPDWQLLLVEVSDHTWQHGSQAERLQMLLQLRQSDPKKALGYLYQTWPDESLREKRAFLQSLFVGLNETDEPFLEKNLDFPRKEVRELAARLLQQLPESALSRRLYEAVTNRYFRLSDNKSPLVLTIKLPTPGDEDLIRDGIYPTKKWKKGGAPSAMLFQLVAAVSPNKWTHYFDEPPEHILEQMAATDWGELLVEAVAQAAVRHATNDWLETVLRFYLNHLGDRNWPSLDLSNLLKQLPNEVFNRVVFDKLKSLHRLPEEHHPLINLLQQPRYQWSAPLAELVTEYLMEWLARHSTFSWTGQGYRRVFRRMAYAMPVESIAKIRSRWLQEGVSWGGWDRDVQRFIQILTFRKNMISELQPVVANQKSNS